MKKGDGDKNIVTLAPRPTASSGGPQPSEEVVKLLEGLLRAARSGELRAVAFAGVRDAGASDTRVMRGWARDEQRADSHLLVAAVGDLSHALHRERYDYFDAAETATDARDRD